MRLLTVFVFLFSLASCKTSSGDEEGSSVKDIESVRKLEMDVGSNAVGKKIAIIKCAPGFRDADNGLQEFGVPFFKVESMSFSQLEDKFCTQKIGHGGGGGGGHGGGGNGGNADVAQKGFYAATNGPGCSSVKLTPKSLGGQLKSISLKCLSDNTTTTYDCEKFGECANGPDDVMSLFDGGLIEIATNGDVTGYEFIGETDACVDQGGMRLSGFCWIYASKPNMSCNDVCAAKGTDWATNSSSTSNDKAVCAKLAAGFNLNFIPSANFTENFGCVHCTNKDGGSCSSQFVGVWVSGEVSATKKAAHQRPFCACNL
jgi:hypothetical protein